MCGGAGGGCICGHFAVGLYIEDGMRKGSYSTVCDCEFVCREEVSGRSGYEWLGGQNSGTDLWNEIGGVV